MINDAMQYLPKKKEDINKSLIAEPLCYNWIFYLLIIKTTKNRIEQNS